MGSQNLGEVGSVESAVQLGRKESPSPLAHRSLGTSESHKEGASQASRKGRSHDSENVTLGLD